jgi:ABC-2 type transport system permease protein
MSTTSGPPISFVPAPGGAALSRMVRAQAGLEVRMILRNGEQLLLTVVIPVLVLTVFSSIKVMDLGTRQERVDFLAPGVLALAVLSTAFTGLAIGTGFERRYGALKRLGATPLPRWALLVSKAIAVLMVEVLQTVLLGAVAFALGWDPHGSLLSVVVLMLAGTAAFSSLGLLMAGTLRAEATLAAANGCYLLFLVSGGIAVPLDRFPDSARPVLELLPAGALSEGLREVLRGGSPLGVTHVAVLLLWAVVAGVLAAYLFRWE